jgi:hypothetical protein
MCEFTKIEELNMGMDVNFYLHAVQLLLLYIRFCFLTCKNSIFMSLYMLINVFQS